MREPPKTTRGFVSEIRRLEMFMVRHKEYESLSKARKIALEVLSVQLSDFLGAWEEDNEGFCI